jgi:DNA polymerase I
MKYQFVNIDYDKDHIKLTGRGEDGNRKTFKVTGFEPYFFVEDKHIDFADEAIMNIESGYKSLFGADLQKITVRDPLVVRRLRDFWLHHWEADVRFVRRFLIDKEIKSGFEIDSPSYEVYHEDVTSSDIQISPKSVFYDLEIDTPNRLPDWENPIYPIIANTFYDTENKQYITYIVDYKIGKHKIADDWLLVCVAKEQDLIKEFQSYLDYVKPDLLANWNIYFDNDYLRARAKKLGIPIDIDTSAHFDMLRGYKKTNFKASNHLKDVVIEEGITKEVVSEKFDIELYNMDKSKFLYNARRGNVPKFIQYSKKDVEFCVKLDEKKNMRDYWWNMRNYVGLENIDSCFSHGVMVDTVLLRLAYGNKDQRRVLSSDKRVVEDSFAGAAVFEPKPGVEKGIAVFDMARYYPSIILSAKLSPERRDGNGILCQMVKFFLAERERYDILLDEAVGTENYDTVYQQWFVVKFLLNAVWGYVGWQGSRIYNKEICATITGTAREGLEHIAKKVEDLGYNVIYGDTDSIAIKVSQEQGQKLERVINKSLKEFTDHKSWEPLLNVKYEKYYSSMVFVEAKSGGGAKKKYAAHLVWEKGKERDELDIKGFDAIRRDNSLVTKNLQKDILNRIARGDTSSIKDIMKTTVGKIYDNKYPLDQIAMTKTINKGLNQYKNKTDFIKAVEYSNQFLDTNIQGGDMIKLLPVKRVPGFPPTKLIAFIDLQQVPKGTEVDVNKIVDKTIRMKMENILKVVNITWGDVSGQTNLSDIFSGQKGRV